MRRRSREEIARFFEGLDVLGPGVVPSAQWRWPGRPDAGDGNSRAGYVGVARKLA